MNWDQNTALTREHSPRVPGSHNHPARGGRCLEERARQKAASESSDPKQAKPKEKDQYNFTDPESRIMKNGDGFAQGYNAQAG
jgi:hypothetical protein